MIKLDAKDSQILYELYNNSRQSYSKIGKKVGLHRNNVLHRINKLLDKEIIRNFYTLIDSTTLGYTYYRFYFTFQNANLETQKEIIDYFVKSMFTTDVHSIQGHHDLAVIMAVNNAYKFNDFWEKSLVKYGDYFAKQIFSIYSHTTHLSYSFLLDKGNSSKCSRKKIILYKSGKKIRIDAMDFKILEMIAPNSRMKTIDIAKKLELTAVTVKKRIKNLFDQGVIRGYEIGLNLPKIGLRLYKLDINLTMRENGRKLVEYIERNPWFIGSIKSIGHVDIELMFCVKDVDQLVKIIEDLYQKFPDTIKDYTYFCITKTHKWQYLPESKTQ